MTFQELTNITIEPINMELYKLAKDKWDSIAKPLDSMGDFEDIICKICSITGNVNEGVERKAIVIACADNGIVEEGVTQCGQEVTEAVAKNLGLGLSSLCILSKNIGADIIPVDIGINSEATLDGVINKKIAKGTRNFLKEPALSDEETLKAIEEGVSFAADLKQKGYRLIAGGEMGIGNTTTSTAVLCSVLNLESAKITGRGAGLSDNGLVRKQEVVRQGIEKYGFAEGQCDNSKERVFEALKCLGGLDLAFLTGLYIGCGISKLPVVLDGFISVTAGVVANKILPGTAAYFIPSHKGRNEGIEIALNSLGLKPIINGNMALGEGTGAAMMFPLIDMAIGFYNSGTTFEQEEIENYKRF